ncbi:MAG: hypothetical protein HKN47_16305 [Pirellulaceae bacterium]|nr:hypothetical protein [Pirellulaceae bacterium]
MRSWQGFTFPDPDFKSDTTYDIVEPFEKLRVLPDIVIGIEESLPG